MPNTKTAIREARLSEKRRLRNKSYRSACKTSITKAEKLILTGDKDGARQAVAEAIKVLDSAASKGIIHQNNAARRKSRLMKKLNQSLAAPAS